MSEQISGISYKANGTRIYPASFKQSVVAECLAGATSAEVARKYQIPMQNIVKWRMQIKKIKDPAIEKQIPASVHAEATHVRRLMLFLHLPNHSLLTLTR